MTVETTSTCQYQVHYLNRFSIATIFKLKESIYFLTMFGYSRINFSFLCVVFTKIYSCFHFNECDATTYLYSICDFKLYAYKNRENE